MLNRPSAPPHAAPELASADARLKLINSRAARAVFAISAAASLLGAFLLGWAHLEHMPHTGASALMWLAFGIFTLVLFRLPESWIDRGGLALFLGAALTTLMVNGILRGQGVHTVGLMFAPLLVLTAALLLRPAQAMVLALWTAAGLVLLYQAQRLELGSVNTTPALAIVNLLGLLLSSIMALGLGLLAARRFGQASRLSVQHEIRYRDLFDRIPSGVILHDNGIMRDANRAALQILGVQRRSEVLGRDMREFISHDEAKAQFETRMEQLRNSTHDFTLPVVDMSLQRRDGGFIQVRAAATALRDLGAKGGVVAGSNQNHPLFLTFMLDDTQRLQAQAETARVRAMLESILSHSPYALSLSRRHDGLIVECNAAYERLIGRARHQILQHSVLELGVWANLQDRERFIAGLSQPDAPNEIVFTVVRSDGAWRWVKGNGALLTFDGVEYLLTICRDVTESRLRDAEHQAIVENAPVGLATTRGGVIISANPRLHEIFGMAPGTMIQLNTRDLWPDRGAHDAREAQVMQDLKRQQWTRFEEEFRMGGRALTVRMQGQRIPDPGEGPRTIVWIMEDITQDRLAAQALRSAVDEAQSANRAKSAFLANMSHELRTPLNGILGLLDMAREARGSAQQHQHLELARESGRVLSDLLNDVLDLSKIEAGRLEIDSAPFDLKAMLRSLEAVHEVLAESHGLNLRMDISALAAHSAWVHGDAVRVRQILNNYLSNAVKFTSAGEVTVRVMRLASNGPMRFEVSDTGPGIALADQSRLFQPFEQGDASTTRRQGGTGLGLAICRELAHLMGGRVGMQSEPGRGSLFWAELPLPPATAPNKLDHLPTPAVSLHGIRLLVAEDNPVNMLITTAMLERAGARVQGVTHGQAALEAVAQAQAAQDPYDLLLMDIQMPVMDGLQAASAIRRHPGAQHLPILALTAGALQTERDAALQAGMNDFITKPIDRDHLLNAVERHLRRSDPPLASSPPTPTEIHPS